MTMQASDFISLGALGVAGLALWRSYWSQPHPKVTLSWQRDGKASGQSPMNSTYKNVTLYNAGTQPARQVTLKVDTATKQHSAVWHTVLSLEPGVPVVVPIPLQRVECDSGGDVTKVYPGDVVPEILVSYQRHRLGRTRPRKYKLTLS